MCCSWHAKHSPNQNCVLNFVNCSLRAMIIFTSAPTPINRSLSMDPLNESKKLALQSPRGMKEGKTVPPKLFELGTNHSSRPKVRRAEGSDPAKTARAVSVLHPSQRSRPLYLTKRPSSGPRNLPQARLPSLPRYPRRQRKRVILSAKLTSPSHLPQEHRDASYADQALYDADAVDGEGRTGFEV